MSVTQMMDDFGIGKNAILDAIDDRMKKPDNGLCWSFCNSRCGDSYIYIPCILREMGGESDINDMFWPLGEESENARLMMMAFMLTLVEDGE